MDRADAAGFGVSIFGHVAIVAIAWFLTLGNPARHASPSSFEVSYVDEVGLTSAAPSPSSEPAAAAQAPEVAPPEEAAPAPVSEPTPAPPREAPRPAPSPRANAQTRPSPPAQTRQQSAGARQRNAGSLLGPDLLRGLGSDRNATANRPPAATYGASQRASVRQAIARALMRCQRQPLPAPEAAAIRVEYRVSLNPDGSLASAQFVRVINSDPALERYERRMRDIALNVINACTPIRGLPPEFYDVPGGWRQFPYQFDPRTVR